MKRTITIIVCIMLGLVVLIGGTLLFLNDPGANASEVSMEETVIVSNGVAEPAMSMVPIRVEKNSGYSFLLEWEVKHPGLLSGINIVNAQGESVFACTGESARIESVVQYLVAGEYMVEIHYLTGEEAFDAFYEHVGEEPEYSDPEEYEYAESGQWEMKYEITLFDSAVNGNGKVYALLMGLIIGILLVVIMLTVTKTDDSLKCKFDERQELVRGRGFKYGFFTVLICNGIFAVLNLLEISLFQAVEVAMLLSILMGVLVFASYCIWNDGYFSLNENRRSLLICFAAVGVINILIGVINTHRGVVFVNNSLTFESANLFCGIMAVILFVVMFLKKIKDEREE